MKLSEETMKDYNLLRKLVNSNLSDYHRDHKPKSGYRYLCDSENHESGDVCTLRYNSECLMRAIAISIADDEWDDSCAKTLDMYLETRKEFIDRYKDPNRVPNIVIKDVVDNIKGTDADGRMRRVIKEALEMRISEAKADRSLIDAMFSDDSIARSLNNILLADDATIIQYVENINTMIDDFIAKSMKQPQTEEETDTEEADSDPFPEENVIDATFREIPQPPAQMLGNIFNATSTQDNVRNVGQKVNDFIGSLNISNEDKEKVKHRRGREMDSLSVLTAKRDDLLGKIRAIEESCEGIENGNNAKRVQELKYESLVEPVGCKRA